MQADLAKTRSVFYFLDYQAEDGAVFFQDLVIQINLVHPLQKRFQVGFVHELDADQGRSVLAVIFLMYSNKVMSSCGPSASLM